MNIVFSDAHYFLFVIIAYEFIALFLFGRRVQQLEKDLAEIDTVNRLRDKKLDKQFERLLGKLAIIKDELDSARYDILAANEQPPAEKQNTAPPSPPVPPEA